MDAESTNTYDNSSYWNEGVNEYVCENTEDYVFLYNGYCKHDDVCGEGPISIFQPTLNGLENGLKLLNEIPRTL